MTGPDAIVRQIQEAFAATELPPPETMINNHCCECADVSAAFAGKRWPEVTLDDVMRGREIALLTPAAWRYYLPAFLTWTIRAPETVDVLQDNLVYQLEPPRDGQGVPEWFNERAVDFSAEQRRAIVGFLEWYRDRDEPNWPTGEAPGHVYNALTHWSK